MKKMMLILSAALLLLCLTNCNSEKNRFAENIPICIKQKVNDQIVRIDEYCSTDDTKRIYVFFHEPTLPYSGVVYDEDCNFFLIKWGPCNPLNPGGFMLSDGTIEYKDDIYHFKRTVFKQK